MAQKLWEKSVQVNKDIERFTVGRDREMDLYLAKHDVLGSMAHITMLESIGLLTKEELEQLLAELKNIYASAEKGEFVIEDGVEDVHSQVELMLTRRLGDIGKKIHSGRSRNDQVLLDLKLFTRTQVREIAEAVEQLFHVLICQSERYKNVLMPGYTHLQIAMPSSFGLWFGAYAESLVDDMLFLQAAFKMCNRNPLGSAAGYGSSFPLNRTMTTELLGFDSMNYNVVYAQMGRGKMERNVAFALATIAGTISKLAFDACMFNSQNFGFVKLPDDCTTGSSIMPHKKNPDVFELTRAKCNKLQSLPQQIMMIANNLPSGYFRDLQIIKEVFLPAFQELKDCLQMTTYIMNEIKVNEHILDDDKYLLIFSAISSAKTLQISYIGMQTQEVVIKPTLKVLLKSDSQNLEEVVVTAMGIKRSEKSLGYAVSSVKGDEITKARESNVLNSLSGKIAGLQIAQSSGTVGGSSSIQIRGASSIGTVSSPLFIIDGLPIDNGSYNPDRTNGIVDVGNRAGDINSDDIESINVLKGAAATALYGARAKDGAIVITTKKGKKNSPVFVTVNSSTRFENVLKLPDFQNEYAQGSYGVYNVKMLNGWGPKISSVQDQQFTDYKGDKVTLKANPDNVKDFYETGMSYINNVSVAGGGEKADFRLSFTSTNQTGVVPGSDYNKYAFSVNAGMNFTSNFTGRISAQYIRSDSEGRPAQGANDSNLLIPLINGLPRTIDIHDIKQNWIDENGKQVTLDPEGKSNNPYWIINKNKFTNNLDRMIGNITLTYKPIEGLTITNNAGTDFYTEGRRKLYAKGTVGALNGKFQTWNLYKRIINNDLMVSYEKTFANDYHFKAMVGHNLYQEEWKNENVQAQNLVVDGLYTYTNAKSTTPVNYYEKKRLVGLYGDISLGYKDMLFINVTGRNDWSSTLPINNRSYFYPSISGSFIFTELMENKDILNYGKIRLSYANVGSDEDPYNLAFKYTPASTYFLQYLGNVNTFRKRSVCMMLRPVKEIS